MASHGSKSVRERLLMERRTLLKRQEWIGQRLDEIEQLLASLAERKETPGGEGAGRPDHGVARDALRPGPAPELLPEAIRPLRKGPPRLQGERPSPSPEELRRRVVDRYPRRTIDDYWR